MDENKAGRDVFDLNFYEMKQEEYLEIDGFSYISEDAIKPISEEKTSTSTIKPDGYARWYKIDEKSANQIMTVDVPARGGFAVYDKEGTIVNFSRASDENSVVLPEDGLIVFGGNSGDLFKISLGNEQD